MKATVKTEWPMDEHPDLSYLGEFTDTPSGNSIDRFGGSWTLGHFEYRYFVPQFPVGEGGRRAFERMEAYNRGDWHSCGCVVTVSCFGVTGTASLWGIESDCGDEYRAGVERDLRREAFEDWRRELGAACHRLDPICPQLAG